MKISIKIKIGTLTNASGKRVRVADGRFRLLPGAGFRVSRP